MTLRLLPYVPGKDDIVLSRNNEVWEGSGFMGQYNEHYFRHGEIMIPMGYLGEDGSWQ